MPSIRENIPEQSKKDLQQVLNNVENGLQSPAEALKTLENSGKYVFHGSGSKLDTLEPRQAYSAHKDGVMKKDGDPAVCATTDSKISIFRSLTGQKVKGGRSGWRLDEKGKLIFYINTVISESMLNVGYVHIFSKEDFVEYSRCEYRTGKRISPQAIIEVTQNDLPDIQVLD